MKIKLYVLGLFTILFLSGCGKDVPIPTMVDSKLKYTDKECIESVFSNCEIKKDEKIDKIVIDKSNRILYAYREGKIVDSFPVSLGKNSDKGPKEKAGDNKTPEGSYSLSYKQYSRNYYKSLKVSYPNKKDLAIARAKGLNPGGFIMIHGQPRWNATGVANNWMLKNNWTRGCIALTNDAMDKLYYAVESGIPIEIKS